MSANTKLFVRIKYKNDSGADAMIVKITRAIDGWSWNGTTWQAGGFNFTPTRLTSISDWLSSQIDTGAGATTITVNVGYAAVAGANVGHLYSVELQLGTTFAWCRRELLPTTTTTVTRVADACSLYNMAATRIMDVPRGYFRVTITPLWNHTDLADSANCSVLSIPNMSIRYTRTDAANGGWKFQAGATITLATSGGTLPVAGQPITIAARWTSQSVNELALGGQALDLWVNGVRAPGATGLAEPSPLTSDSVVTLANDPTGGSYNWPLDAYVTNLVIDSRCPSDAEMARM
jgi:hypothetical protein